MDSEFRLSVWYHRDDRETALALRDTLTRWLPTDRLRLWEPSKGEPSPPTESSNQRFLLVVVLAGTALVTNPAFKRRLQELRQAEDVEQLNRPRIAFYRTEEQVPLDGIWRPDYRLLPGAGTGPGFEPRSVPAQSPPLGGPGTEAWQYLDTTLRRWSERRIDISRLPKYESKFVGRGDELHRLDAEHRDTGVTMASLIAPGGFGKSALSRRWLETLAPWYGDAERVFGWTFYSQGHRRSGASSSTFLVKALEFFGIPCKDQPEADDQKARELATRLGEYHSLLFLDGVEPLQNPYFIAERRISDPGLEILAHELKELGLPRGGLVVFSSRIPIPDVTETMDAYFGVRFRARARGVEIRLSPLREPEGIELLTGSTARADAGLPPDPGRNEAFAAAVKACGGHPLSLMLLGKYIRAELGGEPRNLPPELVEPAEGKGERGEDKQPGEAFVHRLLEDYDFRWKSGHAGAGALMRMLGLFHRPVAMRERDVLVREAEFAQALSGADDTEWGRLYDYLDRRGLVTLRWYRRGAHARTPRDKTAPAEDTEVQMRPRAETSPPQVDTHPIVREYFGERLRDQDEPRFRQAHNTLLRYFSGLVSEPHASNEDELESLYRAVYHGCQGGSHADALALFTDRIREREGPFSKRRMKSHYRDLATLVPFFPDGLAAIPEAGPIPVVQGLPPEQEAWVLADTGFSMAMLGWLTKALPFYRDAASRYEAIERYGDAALTLCNRVDGLKALGNLEQAKGEADHATKLADRAIEDKTRDTGFHAEYALAASTRLGCVLHAQAELEQAREVFERAAAEYREERAERPRLPSPWGTDYRAFQLDVAQDDMERREILDRARQALEVAKREASIMAYPLDQETVGRVLLSLVPAARPGHTSDPVPSELSEAREVLDESVTNLRNNGRLDLRPRALLTRADACRRGNRWSHAQSDLDEALVIARRNAMRLYEADALLLEAHLLLDRRSNRQEPQRDRLLSQADQAREDAERLIDDSRYRLRDEDLEVLKARIALHRGDRAPGRGLVDKSERSKPPDEPGTVRYTGVASLIESLGLEIELPPEGLSVEEFLELAYRLVAARYAEVEWLERWDFETFAQALNRVPGFDPATRDLSLALEKLRGREARPPGPLWLAWTQLSAVADPEQGPMKLHRDYLNLQGGAMG